MLCLILAEIFGTSSHFEVVLSPWKPLRGSFGTSLYTQPRSDLEFVQNKADVMSNEKNPGCLGYIGDFTT